MNLQSQNIAIAAYCGWTDIRYESGEDADVDSRTVYPWEGVRGVSPVDGRRRFIPDYTGSLDAMHEAEKVLERYQRVIWHRQLCICTDASSPMRGGDGFADVTFQLCHTSALQRAEIFLRTIGQWDDNQ
jgi:hypothetical protein